LEANIGRMNGLKDLATNVVSLVINRPISGSCQIIQVKEPSCNKSKSELTNVNLYTKSGSNEFYYVSYTFIKVIKHCNYDKFSEEDELYKDRYETIWLKIRMDLDGRVTRQGYR